jgi:hypothetical protein
MEFEAKSIYEFSFAIFIRFDYNIISIISGTNYVAVARKERRDEIS